jgi:hypothetical protein
MEKNSTFFSRATKKKATKKKSDKKLDVRENNARARKAAAASSERKKGRRRTVAPLSLGSRGGRDHQYNERGTRMVKNIINP